MEVYEAILYWLLIKLKIKPEEVAKQLVEKKKGSGLITAYMGRMAIAMYGMRKENGLPQKEKDLDDMLDQMNGIEKLSPGTLAKLDELLKSK